MIEALTLTAIISVHCSDSRSDLVGNSVGLGSRRNKESFFV